MSKQTFTREQIRVAHERSGGNLDNMLLFLEGKMPKEPRDWIKNFADLCEAAGVQEQAYAIPEKGTDAEKRDAYYRRLELQELVFNKGVNCDMIADPDKNRYYVWFNIILDSSKPFGFRLSFGDDGCDRSFAYLGARPEFHEKDDAIYCFETFTADYEGWLYYYNKCKQIKP